MLRVIAFALIVSSLLGCGSPDDGEFAQAVPAVSETPTPPLEFPTVQEISPKPLDKSQQKELDATLPQKIRVILEKAETLEVLGLSSEDLSGISWEPDVKVEVPTGEKRTELLNSFFFDASAGPNPSACFIPRHGLRATYKGKTVEVIICFQCHLFAVRGDLGKYNGGVYRDGSASHRLFEEILSRSRSGQ
jgi:hypothetical protein